MKCALRTDTPGVAKKEIDSSRRQSFIEIPPKHYFYTTTLANFLVGSLMSQEEKFAQIKSLRIAFEQYTQHRFNYLIQ